MTEIVHRIPWSTPYGYTEVRFTDDPNEPSFDYQAIMEDVKAAEDAYRATYGVPDVAESPMVDGAMREGARPTARPYTPSSDVGRAYVEHAGQRPQEFVDHTLPSCPNNSGHQVTVGKTIRTQRGPAAPIKCSVCKDPQNPKWPLTVGWQNN